MHFADLKYAYKLTYYIIFLYMAKCRMRINALLKGISGINMETLRKQNNILLLSCGVLKKYIYAHNFAFARKTHAVQNMHNEITHFFFISKCFINLYDNLNMQLLFYII